MKRLFPNRIYKSGTGINWCFWLWSDAQLPYLDRLFVFKTPWFAFCVNHIMEPDIGYPHDHTASFLSIIVRGWYIERRLHCYPTSLVPYSDRRRLRRHFNFVRACDHDAHRILDVADGGALTLCFMGPKKREWFYHMPDGRLVHYSKINEEPAS